jgi:ribosomal protein S1
MDSWEVLRNFHHIGSPIRSTVTSHLGAGVSNGKLLGHVTLKVDSPYPAILPYSHLVDEDDTISRIVIPKIGDQLDAVVFNFVDGSLYLTARANDLRETTIRHWQLYYDYIDTLKLGSTIVGVVEQTRRFGIFVNMGSSFLGLIDIGHSQMSGGIPLSLDPSSWPKKGDPIKCRIGYFRLHNQQVGLGWVP